MSTASSPSASGSANSSGEQHQLVFMPYIAMRAVDEIVMGGVRLVNAERLLAQLEDPAIRRRVDEILGMQRERGPKPGLGQRVRGIGILVIGKADFREFNSSERKRCSEFRAAAFLACLARNVRLSGPNAGHETYTSENVDCIYQNFTLANDYVAEMSGTIVQITNMGFKIAETQFVKPAHVPHPSVFRPDENLLSQLTWLRRMDRQLYRRIVRASAVFLESYYNAQNVDVQARLLLQATAFEVLLDLPQSGQRLAFKDHVERLTNNQRERRIRFQVEIHSRTATEVRTVKGLWADRFYTLRNHIIHGNAVSDTEYVFRGKQHHVLIAPHFFLLMIRRLVDEARMRAGLKPVCRERIRWTAIERADEYQPERVGFTTETDYLAHAIAAGLVSP